MKDLLSGHRSVVAFLSKCLNGGIFFGRVGSIFMAVLVVFGSWKRNNLLDCVRKWYRLRWNTEDGGVFFGERGGK